MTDLFAWATPNAARAFLGALAIVTFLVVLFLPGVLWSRSKDKGKKIEVELGENDILVLTVKEPVSMETVERLRKSFKGAIEAKGGGPYIAILDGGMTYSVIHRKPSGQIPPKRLPGPSKVVT